jgi:hypothetical protein
MHTVWLITYKGQTESPYTWSALTMNQAYNLLQDLQHEYPYREWAIEEKDVS